MSTTRAAAITRAMAVLAYRILYAVGYLAVRLIAIVLGMSAVVSLAVHWYGPVGVRLAIYGMGVATGLWVLFRVFPPRRLPPIGKGLDEGIRNFRGTMTKDQLEVKKDSRRLPRPDPDNPYGISAKAKRGINAPTVNADDYHDYPGLNPEPEDKW